MVPAFKWDCCIPPLPENPAFLTLLHGELAETDVLTEKCLINYSLEMLLTKSMLAVLLVRCLPICLLCDSRDFLSFCRSHNWSCVYPEGTTCHPHHPAPPASHSCFWPCPRGIPQVWGRYFCNGSVFIPNPNTLKPKAELQAAGLYSWKRTWRQLMGYYRGYSLMTKLFLTFWVF